MLYLGKHKRKSGHIFMTEVVFIDSDDDSDDDGPRYEIVATCTLVRDANNNFVARIPEALWTKVRKRI